MPLIDPIVPEVPDVDDAARTVRRTMKQMVNNMDQGLARIRGLTNEFGRTALAAALAPDGADLLALYNSIEAVLESAEVGKTIDPLPS